MDKPIHCEQQLYDLMLTCWNANPADRPTFTEILQKLDKFLVKELTDKTEYTTNVTTLNLIDKVKPCLDDSYLKPLV
ncbi:tyrosine-protein kinase receptor torso-like [Teleopsis dalmanni]|nr:tyrosine-protein kinase receptor torso-like [Teleopsis dalmanni]